MKDFKYCIWLCPDDNHPWNTYTEGFSPHVSIYTHLSKEEALEKFKIITECNLGLRVKLIKDIQTDVVENFHSILYEVDAFDVVSWWPTDAHLSLSYQYEKPFSKKQTTDIQKKIHVKTATLTHAKIVKCTGHYSNWNKQVIKDSQRKALVKISEIPPSKGVREWFKQKFKKGTKILYTHLSNSDKS